MKKEGTGNLGASNAITVLGRGYGVLISIIDILKAFTVAKLAQHLFPELTVAGFVAGLAAIVGHIYPFYLRFKGGKGLACLGGLVCFYDPWLLLFYLTVGVILMLLVNRSVFLPAFVSVTFPLIVFIQTGSLPLLIVTLTSSALIIFAHRKNFGRVKRGEERPIRELFLSKFLKVKK